VKRTFSVLVVALGAAVLLSACSSTDGPLAAKVSSTNITRKTLNDDLTTITDNKALTKVLTQSLQTNPTPTNGGVSTKLATLWLNSLVNQAVVDQVFAQRHLKITPAVRAAAAKSAPALYGNAATFNGLPKSFRNEVLARQQRFEAVQATLPPAKPPSDASLLQTFNTAKAQLCPSGQAVAHIQVKTQAEAQAIEAQLAAGASFATLAGQLSQDTGSGPVGGLVACTNSDQYNQLPADFRKGADPLKLGETSAPVQTSFGWHVIRIEPFDFPTARALLISIREQQASSPMTVFINKELLKRKVWVDPRYGRVSRSKAVITILPPTAPNLRSDPADPSTTTASTPAAGATGQ
jgi:hypothetical protein